MVYADNEFKESDIYKYAFDYTALGMAVVNIKLQYLDVNKAYCDIIGYSKEELFKINFKTFTHPDDRNADEPFIRKLMDGKIDHFDSIKRYIHKNGHIIWGKATVRLIRNKLGKPLFYVTQIQDITSMINSEKELQMIANIDYLTGCLNRRAFMQRLSMEMERANRENTALSLILADVDNFKSINDTCGHIAGDKVLYQISQIFLGNIRSYDAVGRYGGEEFIMCLPGATIDMAQLIAERMRRLIEGTDFLPDSDKKVATTCSFGVVGYDSSLDKDIDNMILRVDKVLYKAKLIKNIVCKA